MVLNTLTYIIVLIIIVILIVVLLKFLFGVLLIAPTTMQYALAQEDNDDNGNDTAMKNQDTVKIQGENNTDIIIHCNSNIPELVSCD